jgi:hypothetical protein
MRRGEGFVLNAGVVKVVQILWLQFVSADFCIHICVTTKTGKQKKIIMSFREE